MAMRTEYDSLGPVQVPADKYWGAQTQRSRGNFPIGDEPMPLEVLHAFADLKQAAALTNADMGIITSQQAQLIAQVCQEIRQGQLNDEFPLVIWQTGSGTQSNMNINEVIANRGHVLAGGSLEDGHKTLHPNDHVNASQSSNDTFPTAMHIAAYRRLSESTLPQIQKLQEILEDKAKNFQQIIKIGRTHFMDATPLRLGQEFSGFSASIAYGLKQLQQSLPPPTRVGSGRHCRRHRH